MQLGLSYEWESENLLDSAQFYVDILIPQKV